MGGSRVKETVAFGGRVRHLSVAAACGALLALPTSSLAQSPSTNFYYKLSTQFRGIGMPMDVYNGGPKDNQARLDTDQNVSGQYWRFVPAGDGPHNPTTPVLGTGHSTDINSPRHPAALTTGRY